jgi:hypothetical protein
MDEVSEKRRFNKQHNAFLKGIIKDCKGPFIYNNEDNENKIDDTLLMDDSIQVFTPEYI